MSAGEGVGYYYWQLVYSDLCEQRQLNETYEERVMAIPVEQLSKRASGFPDKRLHGGCVERTAWTVKAPSSCMRFVDDAKYLPEDRTPEIMKGLSPKQNYISFVQMLWPANQSVLSLYSIMEIKALRRVDKDEDLHHSYSGAYKFPDVMCSRQGW